MCRWLLLVSVLGACGDDNGGGDGGPPGGDTLDTHEVLFASVPPQYRLDAPGFGHPLVTASGARAHSIGEATTQLPKHVLVRYDDGTPTGATRFGLMTEVTSLVEDGSGGAFVLGLVRDANERFHPAVAHFGADGTVAWAKSYTAPLPAIWGIDGVPGTFGAEPGMSQVVDGKIAIAAGAGVMAIDTSGAVQWAVVYPQQLQLQQVVADSAGLVVFGMLNADLVQLRYTWTGTLVGTSSSAPVLTNNSFGMQLGVPLRAADGPISLPFTWRNPMKRSQEGLGASGVLVVDASGAIIDNYSYEIAAEYQPDTLREKVGPIGEIHLLSPSLVHLDYYYNDVTFVPPVLARAYFVATPDAKKFSHVIGESVVLPSGGVMSVQGGLVETVTIGEACSYAGYEITSFARVAGPTVPAFAPIASPGSMAITPVVADLNLGATDGGAPTLTPTSNSCHHI